VEKLQQDPDVESVQLNYISQLSALPNDPYFTHQWNLQMINLPAAWEQVKGQNGNIVVAVLDTGIRPHSDLTANIVAGYDPVNNDNDPFDDVSSSEEGSHGTHVASIIGAVTNNNSLFAGAGWNIKVMPVKVFSKSAAGLGASDADVAEGIIKAVDMGADVINLSLGNHAAPSPSAHSVFENALKYAYQHGVTVIAATGNAGDSYIDYPATSQYTIAVGAVGHDQLVTDYSNYGSGLDLVAPGGHGASNTFQQWVLGYDSYNGQESYVGMIGTSQATPHVSAVTGLLYTLGVTDPDRILQILIDSAVNKNDVLHYGAGILNAEAAIQKASNTPTTPITTVVLFAATFTDNGETISIQPVSTDFSPITDGSYTITGIESGISGVYIVGIIDFNQNNELDEGDYFGQTAASYFFANGEHKSGLNFPISKISNTPSSFKNQSIKKMVITQTIP
jgi:serine protease